jgi:arylsulfatase A-like enzyme
MKPIVTTFLTVFTVTLAVAAPTPNVVLIYGDDVGYGDVGAYGSKLIPTPNIDRLAREGLRFTDGHCSAATCTPSRYALLTGVHAFRQGISVLPPNAPLTFSTNILTLPKLFNQAGYHTAIIGKWHLGLGVKGVPTDWNGVVTPGPLEVGFKKSFLLPSTNDRVPCTYLDGHRVLHHDPADPMFVGKSKADVDHPGSTAYPDGKTNPEAMTYYASTQGHNNSVINGIGRIGYMAGGEAALWDDETMADVFVAQARQYISEHKDQPFFLYFSSQDIHVPRAPHPRFQGKTRLGYRGDAMVQLDWATGQILAALEEQGLTENTLVIFSSDNGPVYDDGYDDGTTVRTSTEEVDRGHDGSGIWRGGKYQIYEGGTRVPFIVRWPARVKPGISKAMVCQIDLLASFAALLDIEVSRDEARDSRNTLEAFLGRDPQGLEYMIEEAGRRIALRHGSWKLVTANPLRGGGAPRAQAELYNLSEDPGETVNLAAQLPERVAAMDRVLTEMIESGRMRQ